VLTEETFHNNQIYAPIIMAGAGRFVMATEDYAWSRNSSGAWVRGLPDSNPITMCSSTFPARRCRFGRCHSGQQKVC
jgi:hypothetical protein